MQAVIPITSWEVLWLEETSFPVKFLLFILKAKNTKFGSVIASSTQSNAILMGVLDPKGIQVSSNTHTPDP